MSFLRSNEAVLRYYTEEQQAEVDTGKKPTPKPCSDVPKATTCTATLEAVQTIPGTSARTADPPDPDSATEGVTV